MKTIRYLAECSREISNRLGLLSNEARNEILEKIAQRLEENIPQIIKANTKDIAAGKLKKMSESLLDRLLLTKDRIKSMASGIIKIAILPDPLNKILEARELPNGLYLKRVSVPLGVIGMIYESRPNVTVDAAAICIKTGNAVILKGGSDAINSNRILVKIIQEVLKETVFLTSETQLQNAVQLIDSEDRKDVAELLHMYDLIDVIIPRGGAGLIKFVRENSTVPIIETGASVVHTYVHLDAKISKAIKIILNAKLRRVGICNALDCLILNKEITQTFLKSFISALPKNRYKATKLELRADDFSYQILTKLPKSKKINLTIKKATAEDYHTEFLDYILAVKTVHTMDEAIGHINHHSLKHSEAIITENEKIAQIFLQTVDSACVYWNASTQFSDGGEFGLGAEIGISTQKLHVRGPFALEGLTSYKWVANGNGAIRLP